METNAFQTRTTAIIFSNIMILSIAQLIQEQLARRLRKPNQANPNLNNYRISHQRTKQYLDSKSNICHTDALSSCKIELEN